MCVFVCRLYGTKCQGCVQSIPAHELVMRAAGCVYHLPCFTCIACGQRLQKGDEFVVKDGQLFCRLDFEKEFTLMPLSPKSESAARHTASASSAFVCVCVCVCVCKRVCVSVCKCV